MMYITVKKNNKNLLTSYLTWSYGSTEVPLALIFLSRAKDHVFVAVYVRFIHIGVYQSNNDNKNPFSSLSRADATDVTTIPYAVYTRSLQNGVFNG